MPTVRGDWVDQIVWEWVKGIIENPDTLRLGLEGIQEELEQANQSLFDRMEIIEDQIVSNQQQLDKLLDLYLNGDFPKEVLTERKTRLEEMLANLRKEQNDLAGHVRKATITDEQLNLIEDFCAKIRPKLEEATFDTRRQIIELLDVRGKIAYENDEKVIYLKCLITPEQQPLLPIVISHSSNLHWHTPVELTAKVVFEANCSPANELFSQVVRV
jgi:site-specific DNA recombinase